MTASGLLRRPDARSCAGHGVDAADGLEAKLLIFSNALMDQNGKASYGGFCNTNP